jgi:hypothetical protein
MTISRHLASSKAGNRSFYTHIHKNTLAAKKKSRVRIFATHYTAALQSERVDAEG